MTATKDKTSNESEMKIRALAPWFGSKRTLAPIIVEELGPHSAYWEPFCGSMAVLLAKPPCRMETVNDLHGDLINLATCVRDAAAGPQLYRRLRRAWMDEAIYDECQKLVASAPSFDVQPDIDRAFAYFVSSWLGRNGTSGLAGYRVGKAFCVRYTKNGGHGATRFGSAIRSIPAWRRRLRDVTILRRDGLEILPRIEDAPGVAIYVDSPYITKNGQYTHDFTWLDHRNLARTLARFKKARVVVSYYEHPDLEQLYPGWTKRNCEMNKAMSNQTASGTNGQRAPEVLLINGPSFGGTP